MGLGYNNMISCAKVVLVSVSYSKCSSLVVSLLPPHIFRLMDFMNYTLFPYRQYIYSIDTILYPYALPSILSP